MHRVWTFQLIISLYMKQGNDGGSLRLLSFSTWHFYFLIIILVYFLIAKLQKMMSFIKVIFVKKKRQKKNGPTNYSAKSPLFTDFDQFSSSQLHGRSNTLLEMVYPPVPGPTGRFEPNFKTMLKMIIYLPLRISLFF